MNEGEHTPWIGQMPAWRNIELVDSSLDRWKVHDGGAFPDVGIDFNCILDEILNNRGPFAFSVAKLGENVIHLIWYEADYKIFPSSENLFNLSLTDEEVAFLNSIRHPSILTDQV